MDLFFKNLSEVRGERAGCVILSGTGSDGTYRLCAIKEKSGIVLVQDPASARHTGMPASAIDTGLVDFVITPAEMAGRLIEYFRHPAEIKAAPEKKNKKESDPVKRIMALLANRTRHDFNLYKDEHWYRMSIMVHRRKEHLIEGKILFELGNSQWNIPELRRLLKETAEQHKAFENYPVEHRFSKIGLKKMLLNGRHLREEDPSQNKILLAIEDVTDKS